MNPTARRALRWLPTFAGFPLGGLAAKTITGPVDGLVAAVAGGAITGIVLGAVQAWALEFDRATALRWITATGVGFAVGLGVGAEAVAYGSGAGDLALQGAAFGAAVGLAQALVLIPELGRVALGWAPALAGLWPLGWTVTTAIGVDVEAHYTVFGSSGAVVVTLATIVLAVLRARRAARLASSVAVD